MRLRVLKVLALGALVVSGSVVATPPASAAPASGTVSCSTLSGSGTTNTATLSGCPRRATGGSGRLSGFTPNAGTVTWADHATLSYTDTATGQGPGICTATQTKVEISGAVTASTTRAIPKGSTVSMVICVDNTTFALTNAPGTAVQF